MNEQNQAVEEAQSENIEVVSPGQLLREARELAQLSVDDISKKLHLKATVISAIEENNFDEITSLTFARGYLKAYAKLVPVEEKDILAAFEHYTTAEQQQLNMQTFSNRKGKKKIDSWLTILTSLLLIGIIAAAAVWYMRNQPLADDPATNPPPSEPTNIEQPKEATEEPKPQADSQYADEDNLSPAGELLEPVKEQAGQLSVSQETVSQEVAGQLSGEQASSNQGATVNQAENIAGELASEQAAQQHSPQANAQKTNSIQNDTPAADTQPTENLESSAQGENAQDVGQQQNLQAANVAHLELRFDDSCWINIEDATGERIAIGTKVKGHYTSVNGVPPFTIKLGKPDAVSIWLDGQSREIPYYPKGSIANFELAAN